MKRKTKKIIKNSLLAVLCLGIVGGAAAGGKALYDYSKEDLKTIHPTFHVGGLDTNGEYVDTDQSLYSEPFKCKGLEVKLDFDNDIKYKIFYYESNGDFINFVEESTNDYDDYFEIGRYIAASINARDYARIMITPQWTNVEIPEDKTEEEIKVVKWSNILNFSSQLEIKVLKEQENFDVISLCNNLNDCSVITLKNKTLNGQNEIIDDNNHSVLKISNFHKLDGTTIRIKYNKSNFEKYLSEVVGFCKGVKQEGTDALTDSPMLVSNALTDSKNNYYYDINVIKADFVSFDLYLVCINDVVPTIEFVEE